MRRRTDAGVATLWTVVAASACLLVVGLVHDGGDVLRGRSTAFDDAAGAARAAAQHLDQGALSQGQVVIDSASARSAALEWLATRGTTGEVHVDIDEVTVTVRRTVQLQILRPAQVTVTETATVEAHHGRPAP